MSTRHPTVETRLVGSKLPGIGPAREKRLVAVGIDTLEALIAADPDDVATALHGDDARTGLWHAARRVAVEAIEAAKQRLAPPEEAEEVEADDEGDDEDDDATAETEGDDEAEDEGDDEGEGEDEGEDEGDDEDDDATAEEAEEGGRITALVPTLDDLRRALANASSLVRAVLDVVREVAPGRSRDRARKALKRASRSLERLEAELDGGDLAEDVKAGLRKELERAQRRWDRLLARTMNTRRLRRARRQARRLRREVEHALAQAQKDVARRA